MCVTPVLTPLGQPPQQEDTGVEMDGKKEPAKQGPVCGRGREGPQALGLDQCSELGERKEHRAGGGRGRRKERTDKPLPPSPAPVLGRQDALRGDGLKGCMNRRAYNQRNVIFKENHAPCV